MNGNSKWEKYILKKLYNKQPLTEQEMSRLVCDYEFDREYGDNTRWHRYTSSIVALDGDLWEIDWMQGLTECQEHEFCNQPYEVERKETTITRTIVTYERVDDNEKG